MNLGTKRYFGGFSPLWTINKRNHILLLGLIRMIIKTDFLKFSFHLKPLARILMVEGLSLTPWHYFSARKSWQRWCSLKMLQDSPLLSCSPRKQNILSPSNSPRRQVCIQNPVLVLTWVLVKDYHACLFSGPSNWEEKHLRRSFSLALLHLVGSPIVWIWFSSWASQGISGFALKEWLANCVWEWLNASRASLA